MNKNVEEMKKIVAVLNKSSVEYYKFDNPTLLDIQYDNMYDRLVELEKLTGVTLAGSVTQKTEGYLLKTLPVCEHDEPMLSANKTKDINVIKEFCSKGNTYSSWKLDGLSMSLYYNGGKLTKALTRGNGEFGEDVTAQAKFIKNIPLEIPYDKELNLRGECVISWAEFKRINDLLPDGEKYSHPRNLAAGTIRQLNTSIVKERNINFIAFECITDFGNVLKYSDLIFLSDIGFDVVERAIMGVEDSIAYFDPEDYKFPVDGIMFEYSNNAFAKSIPSTTKFAGCRMALKWKDELYETTLLNIEWGTSRTGLINPVAVFKEVDLDGAMTRRASLHNVSIIEALKLGIGDTITVYRANKVIPQIYENLTKSGTYKIPTTCPICGSPAEIKNNNGVKTLYCTNKDGCKSKVINKIVHFAKRDCMDIDGLGENTIEKFIDMGILKNIEDIYNDEIWSKNKRRIINMSGFGKTSYDNLISSIEKSKHTTLTNFLLSLGIPYTGMSICRKISAYCNGSVEKFIELYKSNFHWDKIDDIGITTLCSIIEYMDKNIKTVELLSEKLSFEEEKYSENSSGILFNKTFAVTGTLERMSRRDMVKKIQSLGGKFVKTVYIPKIGDFYLINNDIDSVSSKNKEAKEKGINIITEDDFYNMIS